MKTKVTKSYTLSPEAIADIAAIAKKLKVSRSYAIICILIYFRKHKEDFFETMKLLMEGTR